MKTKQISSILKLQKLEKSSCICTVYISYSQARLLNLDLSLFKAIFIPRIQFCWGTFFYPAQIFEDHLFVLLVKLLKPLYPYIPKQSSWHTSWCCQANLSSTSLSQLGEPHHGHDKEQFKRTPWETSHTISRIFTLLSHMLANTSSISLKHDSPHLHFPQG